MKIKFSLYLFLIFSSHAVFFSLLRLHSSCTSIYILLVFSSKYIVTILFYSMLFSCVFFNLFSFPCMYSNSSSILHSSYSSDFSKISLPTFLDFSQNISVFSLCYIFCMNFSHEFSGSSSSLPSSISIISLKISYLFEY